MKTLIYFMSIIIFALTLIACGGSSNEATAILETDIDGVTTVNLGTLDSKISNIAPSALSAGEEESLAFMREEEKLARDVYTELYNIYGVNIFSNIAKSEQTHTDAVLVLIERYSLDDPMQLDTYGMFQNSELQFIYDNLIASGSISLLEAYYVGATVEELDIFDLQDQLDNVIDNEDIILVYENLLKGSRNHLRSFDKQIKAKGAVYNPVYISQELYDSIINSPMESN